MPGHVNGRCQLMYSLGSLIKERSRSSLAFQLCPCDNMSNFVFMNKKIDSDLWPVMCLNEVVRRLL